MRDGIRFRGVGRPDVGQIAKVRHGDEAGVRGFMVMRAENCPEPGAHKLTRIRQLLEVESR